MKINTFTLHRKNLKLQFHKIKSIRNIHHLDFISSKIEFYSSLIMLLELKLLVK